MTRLMAPKRRKRGSKSLPSLPTFLLIMATTFSTTFVARQLFSSTAALPSLLLDMNHMSAPSIPSTTDSIVNGFSRIFAASVASPVNELPQGARAFASVESHKIPTTGQLVRQAPVKALPQLPVDIQNPRFFKYNTTYQYAAPDTSLVTPTSQCGSGPEFTEYFQLNAKHRSRLQEDQIIYRTFFENSMPARGTYVELGAFDGQNEANTRFFDHCLGWKGLLIEGNPKTYQKTKRNRPNAHRMSFAPSCSAEYEAVNKTVEFADYPMANSGLKGKAKTYDEKPMVDVPCGPLTPVLEDIFQSEHINFFSLDVEGAEPMVLRTIDFDKVRIDVLMVEIVNNHCPSHIPCETRKEVRAIMKEAGYRRYEELVAASDVYVRPDSEFVLPGRPFSDQ